VTNNGAVTTRDLTNDTIISSETYDSNSENTVNPSLGAIFRVNDRISLRAAAYEGFRAATLRELYRSAFTRRGINLVNNPDLAPERLVGIEAGADFMIGNNATLRLTLFQNTVQDLIQNITRGISGETPEVIEPCGLIGANETCRELDNVGEMEAAGLELEAEYHPVANWSLFLSYLYNDTEITSAPDDPQIIGNRVRQAPEHSFTARIRNSSRWFDTSLLARYVGERYEDDLNVLLVDDFLLFDLRFSRQVSDSTEVYFTIANLLDEEYEIRVGNDGSIEIGRPRFVGLGLRFRH
jgi:outer membrane receptor protein involved in Fe transport